MKINNIDLKELDNQKFIIKITRDFLDNKDKQVNYQAITDNLSELTGARYVSLNVYEESGAYYWTVAITGVPEILRKVSEMLGMHLVGKKWSRDLKLEEAIRKEELIKFDTLSQLTRDALPENKIKVIEKLIGVGEVNVIGITNHNRIIGMFNLYIKKGEKLQNEYLLRQYALITGLYLEKQAALQRLKLANKLITTENGVK